MAGNPNQKIKLLYLIDIISEHSDEEHPLTAEEIIRYLAEKGITSERKSIYNDIDKLRSYGLDIIKTYTPRHGFFLGQRTIDLPEVRLLIDAVRSARFITAKKSVELIGKLEGFLSEWQIKSLGLPVHIEKKSVHTQNEEIYYNIDSINRAIDLNRMINFSYTRRCLNKSGIVFDTKAMVISPYALFWSDDRYYVVGNNPKYNNFTHLRLDRMKKVTVSEKSSRSFEEISLYRGSFDINDYTKHIFNAFVGDVEPVTLRCHNSVAEQIFDEFGDDICVSAYSDDQFECTVQIAVSKGLVTKIMQFGPLVKAISPDSLCEEIKKESLEIYNNYC